MEYILWIAAGLATAAVVYAFVHRGDEVLFPPPCLRQFTLFVLGGVVIGLVLAAVRPEPAALTMLGLIVVLFASAAAIATSERPHRGR